MKSLRSVQLCTFSNEDLELYFSELRDDQVIYVGPSQGVTLDWILDVTGGERIVIAADVPTPVFKRRRAVQ
jgi:hypothetical protein